MESINKFLFHCTFEKCLCTKTIKAYSTDLIQFKNFADEQLGGINIKKIGKEELKKYLQLISKHKPKTVKRKIASLKAMFIFFEFEEIIESNPFRKVRFKIKEPKVLPTVMSMNEVTQIFRAVYGELEKNKNPKRYSYRERIRDVAVIELLFGTGVRVSELCSLSLDNFDENFTFIQVNGKGNKERKIQISNENIKNALQNYFQLFKNEIEKINFLFINRLGSRLTEQSVRLMVKKYTKQTNINKKITPHIFRHSFATLLLEQDVDIKYIQDLLGHSSIVTTQIYTHVSNRKQSEILLNKHPRNDLVLTPQTISGLSE